MDSKTGRQRPLGRGAYLIPSLFTMANVFCGYLALTEAFKAGLLLSENMALAALHFDVAAKAIGFAVLFDGLDGRIARLMGTTSPFGMELDSLADTITFGIAPAFLALTWGVHGVLLDTVTSPVTPMMAHLGSAGWVVSFTFIVCSAARLARFNIQSSPQSPSRVEHKHFVGLPTPAAAGLVAAIVHFNSGNPLGDWLWVPFWLVLLVATSLLMVSTWKYFSFKHIDLRQQRKFAVVVMVGATVGLIYFYSQVVLLLIATTYVLSGIIAKLAHGFSHGHAEPAAAASHPRRKTRRPRSEAL